MSDLQQWQRTQQRTVDHHVYIVYCNIDYEGSDVHSVHATKASAEAELERILANKVHKWCDNHSIEVVEVKP